MSSLRQHRVVIASLFLPNTVVFGESVPSTPHPEQQRQRAPALPKTYFISQNGRLIERNEQTISPPASNPPSQPVSLVDDLIKSRNASKVTTPAILTPGSENANPFSKLITATVTAAAHAIRDEQQKQENRYIPSPPPSLHRKFQTTHSDHGAPRVRRQSSLRRIDDTLKGKPYSQYRFEPNPHCNGGLKNAIDSISHKLRRKLWVGTLGTKNDPIGDEHRKAIDKSISEQCDSSPVWIPDAEFESCYDDFCHQVLWPCLHSVVPDAPKTKLFYESASFKQYVAVNKRFADAIIANYQEGDVVWVNDYHLMLLPALLRSALPAHVPIGFFMHVAFPSSEIFRCLSVRESLLRGVLGADLVGFQTANYARHFRQTVSRILTLEALPKGVQLEGGGRGEGGRFVDVGAHPIGINVGALKEKQRDPEVKEWVQILKQRYSGMKLVVGRDKLDTIQGVRNKIQAFELFLDKYPEFQQKAVLIQVAIQTTESTESLGSVADLVSHINSRFSTLTYQPVVFLHTQDLTFSQYLALLTVADAFLVTSLREGMALRTHEFVECQEGSHRPLILSEFTGSYSYSGFRSCIAINPWDTRGTADAVYQALTMCDEEALTRWEDLHRHVITQTAQAFATSFLSRCIRANTNYPRIDLSSVPHFDVPCVLSRYKYSKKRLLLIDFERTIWSREEGGPNALSPFVPPEDRVELLRKLVADEMNQVWLLSGLPVKGVMEVIGERVPNLGIVAENGCFIKTIPSRNAPATWMNMVVNFNLTWKAACLEILHYFTERTPGSSIEEREATVVWRFWTGSTDESQDRQWARRQAAEAQNHVFDSLGERYGLRIVPGTNSFLVLPNNVSRSTAVGAILHPGGPAHSPLAGRPAWMAGLDESDTVSADVGFVLALGSDEKLLRRLNELDNAETCSTSTKGTYAKWQLDPAKAKEVLWQFANVV